MNTHAVIPLAVLEAVRSADIVSTTPGFGEVDDVPTVRLGVSPTVRAQIERYEVLARRGARVTAVDVGGILKLVGRRRDADLVMAEAGRRAGELVARSQVSRFLRLVHRISPGAVRNRIGSSLVRRTARNILDVEIAKDHTARWSDPGQLIANSGGVRACAIYRAATAELLRRFTSFDGALFDVRCRDSGDEACVWSEQLDDKGNVNAE